jgi:hypothetical protein
MVPLFGTRHNITTTTKEIRRTSVLFMLVFKGMAAILGL